MTSFQRTAGTEGDGNGPAAPRTEVSACATAAPCYPNAAAIDYRHAMPEDRHISHTGRRSSATILAWCVRSPSKAKPRPVIPVGAFALESAMILNVHHNLQKVVEFMQREIPADELNAVADALPTMARALWSQCPKTTITPMQLTEPAITTSDSPS